MPLIHYSHRHLVRLLSTETRRTDTTPFQLSRAHVALGRFLAGELVEHFPLQSREIHHPQGLRTGWEVADENKTTLVVFMRAGLYTAEGIREILPRARVVHVTPHRGQGLAPEDMSAIGPVHDRRLVLVDSVVNTGLTLEPVIAQLRDIARSWLGVVALVSAAPTAKRLEKEYPDVHFFFARISKNQYVGRGAADTGNRLFGTFPEGG